MSGILIIGSFLYHGEAVCSAGQEAFRFLVPITRSTEDEFMNYNVAS